MTNVAARALRSVSLRYRIQPVDRRQMLVGALTLTATTLGGAVLISGGAPLAAPAVAGAPAGFLALSQMLVGPRRLDAGLAAPAWAALSQREAGFAARFAALDKAVAAAGLRDMAQWATSSIAADPALKATAVAIVGAWYLGRVGTVQARSENGPVFITYSGALMWAPTLDVTVIPTYARGRPGFWAEKPVPTLSV